VKSQDASAGDLLAQPHVAMNGSLYWLQWQPDFASYDLMKCPLASCPPATWSPAANRSATPSDALAFVADTGAGDLVWVEVNAGTLYVLRSGPSGPVRQITSFVPQAGASPQAPNNRSDRFFWTEANGSNHVLSSILTNTMNGVPIPLSPAVTGVRDGVIMANASTVFWHSTSAAVTRVLRAPLPNGTTSQPPTVVMDTGGNVVDDQSMYGLFPTTLPADAMGVCAPLTSCTPTVLARGITGVPDHFLQDSGAIYWTSVDRGANETSVWKLAK